jgi:hypothetical protein
MHKSKYLLLMSGSANKREPVRIHLCKMYLNKTYSAVSVGKNLYDTFHVKNGLKHGDALSPLLFNFALEYAINEAPRETGRAEIEWNTSPFGLC